MDNKRDSQFEEDKDIVEAMQKCLDKDTAALCFIGSYIPEKVTLVSMPR